MSKVEFTLVSGKPRKYKGHIIRQYAYKHGSGLIFTFWKCDNSTVNIIKWNSLNGSIIVNSTVSNSDVIRSKIKDCSVTNSVIRTSVISSGTLNASIIRDVYSNCLTADKSSLENCTGWFYTYSSYVATCKATKQYKVEVVNSTIHCLKFVDHIKIKSIESGSFDSPDSLVVSKPPTAILNLPYNVVIFEGYIEIGCQMHTIEEWEHFEYEDISSMDGDEAVNFWDKYKDPIIRLAKLHNEVN